VWLTALPQDLQQLWWRRAARHFCRFQSWEAADASARREVEAELAGRPVALPLKLSAWPMCEALLHAEALIADHGDSEIDAMRRAAEKHGLTVESIRDYENEIGSAR
jgi:hypothetical protein